MEGETQLSDKIIPFLKKTLPPERLTHVYGVIELAKRLSKTHRLNLIEAKYSAALHDLARCWEEEKLIKYVKQTKLNIPEQEWICKYSPVLLHSYVSADLAKKLFKIKNQEILDAVAKHSLASLRMTPLDKLIFLADLVSPDRNFSGILKLRRLAFRSLNMAFVEGLRSKMEFLLKSKSFIHPQAVSVWNQHVRNRHS